MKGSYKIVVRNKQAEYEFVLRRKYTLLVGDSATGKSMLCKMLGDEFTFVSVTTTDGDKGVKIVALPFRKDAYLDLLPCSSPRIFVVDECVEGVNTIEFKRLMESSNAYFILMSRALLHYRGVISTGDEVIEPLPLSINEVYCISSSVRKRVSGKEYYVNKFVNKHAMSDDKDFKVDAVLTEDSGSGFKIYGNCYKGVDLVSANGNGNVALKLKYVDSKKYTNCIAVFVDGAAYGMYMDELLTIAGHCSNSVIIYAPESLEWLLLRAIPPRLFAYPFNNDVLVNPQRYCDKDAFKQLVSPYNQYNEDRFESWEQLFTSYLTYLMSKTKFKAPYTKKDKLSDFYLNFSDTILKIINTEL